jgi:photosystem II stability/assembly factor-like uncharacterized protein
MKKLTIFLFLTVLIFSNAHSQWTVRNVGSIYSLNAVYFINSQTGWVAGDSVKVFKTTDGGVNWTQQYTGLSAGTFYSLAFANDLTGWVVGAYQNSGTNGSDYMITNGYIYMTTNGGTSWSVKLGSPNHIFYTSFVKNTATCWVAGTNNGTNAAIIMTSNGGANWITQVYNQYNTIKSVFFINDSTGWAVGYNTFLKTTTSGSPWSPTTISGDFKSVFFTNANTGYAGTSDGLLMKSTTGGNSWTQNINVNSSITSIYFANSGTGFFTSKNLVFKTTNSGVNWTPMGINTQSLTQAIHCPTVNNCFVAATNGNFIYTNNGGGNYSTNTNTFRRNNLNKPITMNNITYDTINVNLTKSLYSILLDINVNIDTVVNGIDSGLVFILSHQNISDTLIYRAGGSGNNFIRTVLNDSASQSINSGTPPFTGSYRPSKPLSQFNYTSPNGLWILRIKESQNREKSGVIKSWGITITYNSPVFVNKISEIVPSSYELKQNYPNPFNPTTNIKYQIANNKFVILKIYDILGKEIETLVNERQSPGVYEVTFDGSALSSGVYFYKLTADNYSETKKLVLIK